MAESGIRKRKVHLKLDDTKVKSPDSQCSPEINLKQRLAAISKNNKDA